MKSRVERAELRNKQLLTSLPLGVSASVQCFLTQRIGLNAMLLAKEAGALCVYQYFFD